VVALASELEVQVCKKCGKKYFPFKARCYCGSAEFSTEKVKLEGTVLTHTTIYVPPKGFPPPIKIVLVELECGMKLLGRYVGSEDVEIGDKVVGELCNGVVLFRKA